MLLQYSGYSLDIIHHTIDCPPDKHLHGNCPDANFSLWADDYNTIISTFKKYIDNGITNAKEDFRYYEYKGFTFKGKTVITESGNFIKTLADCKEIGYTQIFQHSDYEWIIEDFKKAVDYYITKETKKEQFQIKENSELGLYIGNLDLLEFEERHYRYSQFKVNERLYEIWTWYREKLGFTKEDVKAHYVARYKK